MAVPIVTSVTREVMETVPTELKEGAYALGATRWEMVRRVSFRSAGPDRGCVILGLGRAIGEAIAVTQVVGERSASTRRCSPRRHAGGTDRRAVPRRGDRPQTSSLAYLALILLVFAIIVNVAARLIVQRMSPKEAERAWRRSLTPPEPAYPGSVAARRRRVNRVVEIASTIAALLAVAVLVLVIGSVAVHGSPRSISTS